MANIVAAERTGYNQERASYSSLQHSHASTSMKQYVPLTCHGHSRPVPHLSFSGFVGSDPSEYYMISACKDSNPMLRDGVTGDWIGTFFGHKGAVWQARLSPDASYAATASADFTAKIWDTHTGETLWTIKHDHIVRAVAFPQYGCPEANNLLATGGFDKQLRIFDLSSLPRTTDGEPAEITSSQGFKVGDGVHGGWIKSVIFTYDPNIIVTTCDDRVVRWWDITSRTVIQEFKTNGAIGSCEFHTSAAPSQKPLGMSSGDIGGGMPVLCIAAGRAVHFYGGAQARTLLKSVTLPYEAASVALHTQQRKFVVGGSQENNTWARVYNYDDEKELGMYF